MGSIITVGYDVETDCVGKIQMDILTHCHGAITGASGSGKSIALLYLLYQILSLDIPIELFLIDPKCSGDFAGIVPPDHYASGVIDSIQLINKYYKIFQDTPEGNGVLRLVLIDEYAGLISSIPSTLGKEGKAEAEKIKSEISIILMMGRSRRTGVVLIMQRASASLVTSGSLDNILFCLNTGKMHTFTHTSLFANEHLENEEFASTYRPSCSSGFFWQDGQSLKAIRVPLIKNKSALIKLLRQKARNKLGNF